MGKDKTKIHEEPTWKQQRKKLEAEARRNKIYMVLGIAAIAIVAVGLVLLTVRGMVPHKPAKGGKVEQVHAIATVIGSGNSIIDGKNVQVMSFRFGKGDILERPITAKDKTLRKDDQVLLTYSVEVVGGARKIVDWAPFVESKEPTPVTPHR